MKIFFDGKIFSQQKTGGISRIGFELIKNLAKKPDVEQIFYRGFYIDKYVFKKEWFKKYYGIKTPEFLRGRPINFLDNFFCNYFYKINANKDLIYHSLFYRIPKIKKGPLVVHCHDMIHELFHGPKKAIDFKKKSFDSADLIIAISESTKRDILRIYPKIKESKIAVAHLGVSEHFFSPVRGKKTNIRPYFLYVGPRNYKYKNFDLLFDVFVEKSYFLNFDLVLVGGEKQLTEEQKDKIKKTVRPDSIRQQFCSDEELADLYKNASVFIYPSLYEGFGIPPLEAMASGCPVLASNSSSIPEVVGQAGLLFNPEDKNDFAGKLEKIVNDNVFSLKLKTAGKERARQFTWDNATEKIYQEYIKLL